MNKLAIFVTICLIAVASAQYTKKFEKIPNMSKNINGFYSNGKAVVYRNTLPLPITGLTYPLTVGCVGDYQKGFGASRGGGARCHQGCDVITSGTKKPGDVLAVADGEVLKISKQAYHGKDIHGKSYKCDAVKVYHPSIDKTLVYAEIDVGSATVSVGDTVKQGDKLGDMKISAMLHLEVYSGKAKKYAGSWKRSGGKCQTKPTGLLNCEEFLENNWKHVFTAEEEKKGASNTPAVTTDDDDNETDNGGNWLTDLTEKVQEGLATKYEVTARSLNRRNKPTTSGSTVLETMKTGKVISVVSIENGWAKLADGSYCSAKYIKKVDDAPVEEEKEEKKESYNPLNGLNNWLKGLTTGLVKDKYVVISRSLNRRNKPTTKGSTVLENMKNGKVVVVDEIKNGWAKLADGSYCSASPKYLKKLELPAQTGEAEDEAAPVDKESKADDNDDSDDAKSAEQGKEGEDVDKETLPARFSVTANKLSFRKGPGTNFERIKYLRRGDIVTVLEIKNKWAKLKEGGYAHASFLINKDYEDYLVRKDAKILAETAKKCGKSQLTKSFTMAQLTASWTAKQNKIDNTPKGEHFENICFTATKMERVQEILGHPLRISSSYRCPALNALLPGASKTSQHMTGQAMDFTCPGFGSALQVWEKIQEHKEELQYDQLLWEWKKIKGDKWVHCSFKPTRNRLQAKKLILNL